MHRLTGLRRQEVADLAPGSVAVLPIGSLEQHGEHLPLGTDSLLVEAVVDRALGERDEVVLCPTLPYGFSGHHQFAVALSLPREHCSTCSPPFWTPWSPQVSAASSWSTGTAGTSR